MNVENNVEILRYQIIIFKYTLLEIPEHIKKQLNQIPIKTSTGSQKGTTV